MRRTVLSHSYPLSRKAYSNQRKTAVTATPIKLQQALAYAKRSSLLLVATLFASFLVAPAAYASSGYQVTNQTAGTPFHTQSWHAIASSGSGKYLVAAEYGGDLIISSDYGAHWKDATAGTSAAGQPYLSLTMSYTGQYAAATTTNGDIWTSADYGAHWKNRTAGTTLSGLNWGQIITSASGQYIVAVAFTDGTFVSGDYGAHWKNVASGTALSSHGIVNATISSTGQYLTAVDGGADIYGSHDYGATWTKITTGSLDGLNFYSDAASADGKFIVGAVDGGDIYASHDYGATWTNLTASTAEHNLDWTYLQASPTGQFLVGMLGTSGSIYTSRDYGVTWIKLTSDPSLNSKFWTAAYISASGQHIAATAGTDDIYNFNDSSLRPANPVITNHSSAVSADGSVTVNVLGGASGYDPDTLAIVSGPSHGTAVDPPGDITYTPNKGYTGTDSLVYQLCAPLDDTVCSQATLTFTVLGAPNTGFGKPPHINSLLIPGVVGSLLLAGMGIGLQIWRRKNASSNA